MWNDKANELFEQICELNTRQKILSEFHDDISYRSKFGEPMTELLTAIEIEQNQIEISLDEVSEEHKKAEEKANKEYRDELKAMNREFERSQ